MHSTERYLSKEKQQKSFKEEISLHICTFPANKDAHSTNFNIIIILHDKAFKIALNEQSQFIWY